MSIIATLPVFLFSNTTALENLLSTPPHDISSEDYVQSWKNWVFAASHQRDSSRPEHVFEMRWKKYSEGDPTDIVYALRCIAKDYLYIYNGQLYVKSQEYFSRWQNLRGRISTLPIKVLMASEKNVVLEPALSYPHNQQLRDFIQAEGLNECHMHLNGYRFPEECWLDTLYNLHNYIDKVSKKLERDSSIEEMFRLVNPSLTPFRQYSRLKLALYLRHFLLALGGAQSEKEIGDLYAEAYDVYWHFTVNGYTSQPPRFITKDQSYLGSLHSEIQLWNQVFQQHKRSDTYRQEISFFAQLYLLILNEFIQLNRHNECNKGFSPFNKTSSLTRVGVDSPHYYKSVFMSILRVSQAGVKNSIEVRLTPESVVAKGVKLMRLWQECCQQAKRTPAPQLIMVGHFIKEKPSEQSRTSTFTFPDHSKLCLKCIRQADKLATFAKTVGARNKVPVGVDAANSEQNAPAEVFAPAFRHFEHCANLSYKTFHCGEDFLHLVSGIRAVSDAVNFLDLKNGNRVGHATAIGIAPKLWVQSMPSYIVIPRGEWLLNLIFARNELTPTISNNLYGIEDEAIRQASVIFSASNLSSIDIHTLTHFYHARHLLPQVVHRWLRRIHIPMHTLFLRNEMSLVEAYESKRGKLGLMILDSWHYDKEVKKRASELIEVKTDTIPIRCLIELQQSVQRTLKQRNVIIECPLVSNLRISQYVHVEQHHLLRWLGIGENIYEGDEKMDVCLGSDDPGIFVTDIQNEYHHLYNLLENSELSKKETMNIIRQVGDISRVFSFRAPANDALNMCMNHLKASASNLILPDGGCRMIPES